MKWPINGENVCLISETVHNKRFFVEATLIKIAFIDPPKPGLPSNDLIVMYDRITQ